MQQAHTVYPIKTDIILLQVGSLACSTAQSLGKSSAVHFGRFHTCAWHHGSWVPNQHHYRPSHSSRQLPFVRLNCCINTIALSLCCLSGAHLGLTAVCSLLCRAAPKRSSLLRLHGRRRQASVRSHLTDFVYQALASARRDLFGRCLGTTTKTTIPPLLLQLAHREVDHLWLMCGTNMDVMQKIRR